MELRGRWLIIPAFLALAAAAGLLIERQYREKLIARKFIDDAGMVPLGWVEREERYLEQVMEESGVDFRIRLVPSTRGQPLPAFALDMMREQGIGKDVGGRGLLIVIDDSTREARIEVGPHLEGVFSDAFVAYLIRDQLAVEFDSAGPARALWATGLIILRRIREARLGREFDPGVLVYLNDMRNLARGGGASVSMPHRHMLHRLLDQPGDSAIAEYFAPQPTVEGAYLRQQEFLALGLWPRYVPLFLPSAREFMRVTQSTSRGWNDYLLMAQYGYAYEIDERGDFAMLYYTGTPFESPHFFRRSAAGWQMDIVADVRNSQEIIGAYYTWRMRVGRDRAGAIFFDRYQQIDGTDFGEFYRIRGGDNRPLCIYGEPETPVAKRAHKALCLADSLWKTDAR